MPQLRVQVSGERIRSFLNIRLREVDRQIERGNAALKTIKEDLEAVAKATEHHIEQVQARMMRAPQGLSGLGIAGEGYGPMGNMMTARNQIGRVENTIAELAFRRSQIAWLGEQFDMNKMYELDGPDLSLLGMVSLSVPGMFAAGSYSVGGDPFDLNPFA